MKPRIDSITYSTNPYRRPPAAGDRRTTKTHGLQIRVRERHNGMDVVSSGRPCYVWLRPDQLAPGDRHHLTAEERAQHFPEPPKP